MSVHRALSSFFHIRLSEGEVFFDLIAFAIKSFHVTLFIKEIIFLERFPNHEQQEQQSHEQRVQTQNEELCVRLVVVPEYRSTQNNQETV